MDTFIADNYVLSKRKTIFYPKRTSRGQELISFSFAIGSIDIPLILPQVI